MKKDYQPEDDLIFPGFIPLLWKLQSLTLCNLVTECGASVREGFQNDLQKLQNITTAHQ